MKAIVDVKTNELVVTLSFFQIGGYATTSELQELKERIDELKTRTTAVEDDLNSRTFG